MSELTIEGARRLAMMARSDGPVTVASAGRMLYRERFDLTRTVAALCCAPERGGAPQAALSPEAKI